MSRESDKGGAGRSTGLGHEARPAADPVKRLPRPVITGAAATGRFISLPPAKGPPPARSRRDVRNPRAGGPPTKALGLTAASRRRPLGRPRTGVAPPSTKPAAEHKRVVRMGETIAVSELAQQLAVKSAEVMKRLWALGLMGVRVNHSVDADTAALVAGEFGFRVDSRAFREEELLGERETAAAIDVRPRAPVVTVMGHVDHGKTSLLDAIRKANVAAAEAGGITQHIGAHRVSTARGDVVFLDTPGHEAFTAMRARGARMTDIVVLVVAADDGPMPQTIEAIAHARAAGVPIVVAINKIDRPDAQPARVRTQLLEHGLVPEQLGGDTVFVDLSARTHEGIDSLLEMLALHAELLQLQADVGQPPRGHVVEARLDPKRGAVVTLLVTCGTLRTGDVLVAGEASGRVRAMVDDRSQRLAEAGPAMPVEVMGLDAVPEAGELFHVVDDERAARIVVEHRRARRRQRPERPPPSLETVFGRTGDSARGHLRILLKADVRGSAEALTGALRTLSTNEVEVVVVATGVGAISESDVALASASSAVVLGFNVRPTGKAQRLAERDGVRIKSYGVIYQVIDDVRGAMAGLLAPVQRERVLGHAEVRQLFSVPRSLAHTGQVAGGFVLDGKLSRKASVRVIREGVVVHSGRLASLRRFKEDVAEVPRGYEFGLSLESFSALAVGDVIEAFDLEILAPHPGTRDAPTGTLNSPPVGPPP